MTCACSATHEPPVLTDRHVGRRALLAGGLAAGLTPFLLGRARPAGAEAALSSEGLDGTTTVTRDFSFLPPRPADEVHVRPMMFPVLPDPTLGRATWTDTYLAPRSGGRKHEGQDLMGKKLLKLLACVSGTIVELRHQSSGNSLYLQGDDGWFYCYLHINNDDPGTDNGANQLRYAFAPGVEKGAKVKQGDLLAYLGDSGNAESTLPHCHFEIRMPNAKWYNAAAVNPKYSLDEAIPAKLRTGGTTTATGDFAPFADARAFASRQCTDFLAVTPSGVWLDDAAGRLESAAIGADAFIAGLLDDPAVAGMVAPTIRLYLAYFLRQPDTAGIQYWIRQVRAGTALDAVSSRFAASSEFANRYGSLGNADFVKLIYRNLFDRAADPSGLLFWTAKLDQGASRGWVMRQLCESGEYRRTTADQVDVITVHLAMLGRAPRADEYVFWTTRARATGVQSMIELVRTGHDYADRIAGLGG